MKNYSLIFLMVVTALFFSTKSRAQFLPTPCMPSDSVQDLPRLIAGQPYFQSVHTACMFDSSITTPLPITVNIRYMKNVQVFGLPPGFTVTNHYSGLPDSSVYCFDISAPASAVDAAIAASPNGDGVYTLQYVAEDVYVINADPQSVILSNYTWASSLGWGNIPFTIMLGYNTGGSNCYYSLFYNGNSTYYAGLPATSGNYSVNVYSSYVNCPNFSVTPACNWLTVTPQYTTNGDGSIAINYTANALDTARYCDIIIGNNVYYISQIEAGCNVAMSIDSSFVGPLEGTVYVSVTASDSCYWSIINRDFCDWLDINPQYGMGSDTVEISYNANTTNQARSCDINISGKNLHFEQQAVVGIAENKAGIVDIYPNPANDFVTIATPAVTGKELLNIYTIAGQLLSQTQLTNTKQQISTSNLANGLYVFTVQNAQGVLSRKKLIINR